MDTCVSLVLYGCVRAFHSLLPFLICLNSIICWVEALMEVCLVLVTCTVVHLDVWSVNSWSWKVGLDWILNIDCYLDCLFQHWCTATSTRYSSPWPGAVKTRQLTLVVFRIGCTSIAYMAAELTDVTCWSAETGSQEAVISWWLLAGCLLSASIDTERCRLWSLCCPHSSGCWQRLRHLYDTLMAHLWSMFDHGVDRHGVVVLLTRSHEKTM